MSEPRPTRLQCAIRLGYSIGLSPTRIAAYYGTSISTVRVVASRHGWSWPKRTGIGHRNVPADKMQDYKHLILSKKFSAMEAFKILQIEPGVPGHG